MAHGVVFQKTVKFRRGHPQQERQIEVGYTKNWRFSTSISEIPIPNTDTDPALIQIRGVRVCVHGG